MFNRSFLSVLFVAGSLVISYGQSATTPEKGRAAVGTAMAFTFEGDGSYLGIQTEEVTKANFAKFGLNEVRGVAVESVQDNSPAASAGLRAEDVIVKFDGEEVTGSRKLVRLISEVAPDHQVRLTIVRGGSEQEITVTLAKRPMPKFEGGNFTFAPAVPMGEFRMPNIPQMPMDGTAPRVFMTPDGQGRAFSWAAGEGRQIGVGVYPVTKQLGEKLGVEGGLMINDVAKDSPAAKAGLIAGDIIVEVDSRAVKNNPDLIKAVNGKKEGSIQLTVVRDGRRLFVPVTPEAAKGSGFIFQNDGERPFAPQPPAAPATPATPAGVTLVRPARII